MSDLDRTMRRRLRALQTVEDSPLGELDRAKVVRLVAERGPTIVRRARVARNVKNGALVVASIAALVGVTASIDRSAGVEPAMRREAPIATAPAAAPQPEERRCEGFAQEPAEMLAGDSVLDLGSRARIVADVGGDFGSLTLEPCTTRIALRSGRIAVHAKDLGGGQLQIETRLGSVTVHGTVFSVELLGDLMIVEVAEGAVGVKPVGREEVRMHAGEQVIVSPRGVAREHAPADALEMLLDQALGIEGEEPTDDALIEEDTPRARRPRLGASRSRRSRAHRVAEAARVLRRERMFAPADSPPTPEPIARSAQPAPEPEPEPEAQPRPPPPLTRPEAARLFELPSVESLVARGDRARRQGEYEAARRAYDQAGRRSGPTAEAAWIALARMELGLSRPGAVLAALAEHADRFPRGAMTPEALWLSVRAHALEGDARSAAATAKRLLRDHAGSAHAEAAERWLIEHGPERP